MIPFYHLLQRHFADLINPVNSRSECVINTL